MGLFDNIDFSNLGGGSDYSAIGSGIDNYVKGINTDYSPISSAIGDYMGSADTSSAMSNIGGALKNADWGKIVNTLGRLGIGIGSGIAGYQAGQQATYIPYTRWLGNGLAQTGYINNSQNRSNQLNQAYGAGRALSSLLGQGYSLFGNNKLSSNLSDNPTYNWDDYYKTNDNYGVIGRTINDYVGGR